MSIIDRIKRINQADLTVSQADILHTLALNHNGLFSIKLKKLTSLTVLAESINKHFHVILKQYDLTIKTTWIEKKEQWFLRLITLEELKKQKIRK
jgi:hypothetical protein